MFEQLTSLIQNGIMSWAPGSTELHAAMAILTLFMLVVGWKLSRILIHVVFYAMRAFVAVAIAGCVLTLFHEWVSVAVPSAEIIPVGW